MSLNVGSRLGHYDVTALIGEGGMGQVYRARDTKLDRRTWLKAVTALAMGAGAAYNGPMVRGTPVGSRSTRSELRADEDWELEKRATKKSARAGRHSMYKQRL